MNTKIWMAIGIFGQLVFAARFVVQWWASERQRRSVVPVSFWYFSLAGGLILLSYAMHLHDPVFIFGQAGGALIYLRNLAFIRRSVAP